jgi:hypothetical protein
MRNEKRKSNFLRVEERKKEERKEGKGRHLCLPTIGS